MAVDMTPKSGDYSINLPITFDYKGGRGENKTSKILLAIIITVLTIILVVAFALNENIETWQRILLPCAIFYIGLFLLRFFVFKELWYSDIFETF